MSDPFLTRSARQTISRMLDSAVERVAERKGSDTEISRRQALAVLARTTGSALVTVYGASLLAACGSQGPDAARSLLRTAARRNETVERWLFRHTSMNHSDARLAGAAFPTYHVAPVVPQWDLAVDGPWTLAVTGLVARPLRLTLDELQRLPRISHRVDHFCVEGWDAVATWHGVRVSDLAALAGVVRDGPAAAHYVDFKSFDVETPGEETDDAKRNPTTLAPASAPRNSESVMAPPVRGQSQLLTDLAAGRGFHESWDLPSALHPQTIVAYGFDGALLTPGHGAPARVHSPIKLGYKQTKYLTEIVFRGDRNGGYWSDQGYEWYGGT